MCVRFREFMQNSKASSKDDTQASKSEMNWHQKVLTTALFKWSFWFMPFKLTKVALQISTLGIGIQYFTVRNQSFLWNITLNSFCIPIFVLSLQLYYYRLCLICHNLGKRRRGALQSLHELLYLPPVGSSLGWLHLWVWLVRTITYEMCLEKCWGGSKLDIYGIRIILENQIPWALIIFITLEGSG